MCTLGPGSVLCRQELGESSLLKLCQSWEERAEEQLTLKQEEGEAGWASEAPGRGRQNPQSLGVHRPGLGGGLQIIPLPCACHSPGEWTQRDSLARGQRRVRPKLTHGWVGARNHAGSYPLGSSALPSSRAVSLSDSSKPAKSFRL